MRVLHTSLNVRDMARSLRFWTELLGFKLTRRREIPENDAEIAFVEAPGGGSEIELSHWRKWKAEEYVDGTLFDHVALGVEDVAATVARLRAAGVEVAKEPYRLSGGSGTIAFIFDPDGNWIELIERRS